MSTKSHNLMGRDPSKGRFTFKTGIVKPRRFREKIRGDKYHVIEKRRQLRGE